MPRAKHSQSYRTIEQIRRARGPEPVIGRQSSCVVAASVEARIHALAAQCRPDPNGPTFAHAPFWRWALAVGRSILIARLAQPQRPDYARPEPLKCAYRGVSLPRAWMEDWPLPPGGAPMRWPNAYATRWCIDEGLAVLEAAPGVRPPSDAELAHMVRAQALAYVR